MAQSAVSRIMVARVRIRSMVAIVAFGISKKNLTHVILYLHSPGWVFLICFPEIGKPVYAANAHAAAKNIANSDRQEVCE